ncbi:TAF7 [Branchiostoma lanceolatum]|uniref:TAF7 protein n=1 Tax=Branchiostoma lanceolatum TaxID=7740 RepID=A0A8K0A432_BRALA|nr:TAF7 [Branchiostoma lanceolatum]
MSKSVSKNKENQTKSKQTKDDIPFELEQQFILRMPKGPSFQAQTEALRKAVQSGSQNLKDRLSIEFQADQRHATVRFDGEALSAKLVDLPCVVESHKTIDKKTLYKTNDICQMLVCSTEDQDAKEEEVEESTQKKDKDKKFLYNHGITPALKNVRKRRFRKTMKKKYIESPDVEKEVKRLLKVDNEAVNVRWEVIADDENENKEQKPVVNLGGLEIPSPSSSAAVVQGGETSMTFDNDLHELFKDVSSSDEEEGEEMRPAPNEEEDVNIMDSEDEASRGAAGEGKSQSGKAVPSTSGAKTERKQETNTSDRGGLQTLLQQLESDLARLQEKRNLQEEIVRGVGNEALRQRFQADLSNIRAEEARKETEIARVMSALDSS